MEKCQEGAYFVEKSTDTFADVLVAYGLAYILSKIARYARQEIDIHIKDCGSHYCLKPTEAIKEEWVDQCDYFTAVPLLVTTDSKGRKKPLDPAPMEAIDYAKERNRNKYFYDLRDQLSQDAKQLGATIDQFPELRDVQMYAPRPEWPIYAQVNQMSAINAYNGMVQAWYEAKEKDCFSQHLDLILQMFSALPNNIADVQVKWKKLKKEFELSGKPDASATQVYNPATGKGANRSKADGLTIGGQSNFWLLEYLKLIGMFHAGIPRVVRESKDRKTYILLPNDITLSINDKLFKEFNGIMYANTAIKMDILAALRYAKVFLKHWKAGHRVPRQWSEFQHTDRSQKETPGSYINGLAVAFYKYLGSAHAVLNQSTIGLPDWIGGLSKGNEGIKQANRFLKMIKEHEQIIRQFEEKRNLEYELLSNYRDFLSSGQLDNFFEFTGGYSSYIDTNAKENITLFSTYYLKELIMSHDENLLISDILENEGFQNIAKAIRESTVRAQFNHYRRKGEKDKRYDIRYGLGQELLRKGKYPREFLKALTSFMVKYSHENAMVAEQEAKKLKGEIPDSVWLRPEIQSKDIDAIGKLIDRFKDSELICNLLVAYGYATDYGKKAKEF